MTGPVSNDELAVLPPKARKDPAAVAIYQQHDYLTAYANHTDLRVARDGYRSAVGAVSDWERHGKLQCDFLISQDMQPRHALLDIGCGTGRLARVAARYLDLGQYCGVDLSAGAINAARELAVTEGWADRRPSFSVGDWPQRKFDFLWAFSVMIHLPADHLAELFVRAASVLAPAGVFFFSYSPERVDKRTGLKQFRHTPQTYQRVAAAAGLRFSEVKEWRGEQHIAAARRA